MTQMTPDHRGIITSTNYPSSCVSNRASSIDSLDADSLHVYVASSSSKQQDLDACSTASGTDVDLVTASAASTNFDFDLDLLPVLSSVDCQVPSLELPFPELDKRSDCR